MRDQCTLLPNILTDYWCDKCTIYYANYILYTTPYYIPHHTTYTTLYYTHSTIYALPYTMLYMHRDTEKTPGWVITSAWRSDASMHRKGYLALTYASRDNCPEAISAELQPDINYRRALLSTVLIREEELRSEDDIKKIPDTPCKVTLRHLKNYFLEYLYGDRNVDNKVTMLLAKTAVAALSTTAATADTTAPS